MVQWEEIVICGWHNRLTNTQDGLSNMTDFGMMSVQVHVEKFNLCCQSDQNIYLNGGVKFFWLCNNILGTAVDDTYFSSSTGTYTTPHAGGIFLIALHHIKWSPCIVLNQINIVVFTIMPHWNLHHSPCRWQIFHRIASYQMKSKNCLDISIVIFTIRTNFNRFFEITLDICSQEEILPKVEIIYTSDACDASDKYHVYTTVLYSKAVFTTAFPSLFIVVNCLKWNLHVRSWFITRSLPLLCRFSLQTGWGLRFHHHQVLIN